MIIKHTDLPENITKKIKKPFRFYELTGVKDVHSIQQLRYYWVCMRFLEKKHGEFTSVGYHDYFKKEILGIDGFVFSFNGHEIKFSVRWLDKPAFADYITEIDNYIFQWWGLRLPDVQEYLAGKWSGEV